MQGRLPVIVLAFLLSTVVTIGVRAQEPPWIAQTPDGALYLVYEGQRMMLPLSIRQLSDEDFSALPIYGAAQQPPAAPQESLPPSAGAPAFAEGTKVVGADIAPGTYRTRAAASGCYWARLSGFGGTLGEVLANGNSSGPVVVTIEPGDAGFESRRCGSWTTDFSSITSSQTDPFAGEGIYIVGTDVAPGTWRAQTAAGCYWARLRGFSGRLNDIIANGNPAGGSAIVTIAASDKGFTTSRCGTWTRT